MRVIGVDPGYGRTGVAVLEHTSRDGVIALKLLETPKKMPHEKRLAFIYDGLMQVMEEHRPEVMAIEKLLHGSNSKTVIGVAEARGVALLAGAKFNLPVYEYTPKQVKQTVTGSGSADKTMVAKMLAMTLNVPTQLWIDDVTDALGIAFANLVEQPMLKRTGGLK